MPSCSPWFKSGAAKNDALSARRKSTHGWLSCLATDSITLPDIMAARFDQRVATWIRLASIVIILAMLTC